jgi:hypothetical protein
MTESRGLASQEYEGNEESEDMIIEKIREIISDIEKRIDDCGVGLAITLRPNREVSALSDEEKISYWGQIAGNVYYQRIWAHAKDLDSIYERFPGLKPKHQPEENPPGAW